MILFKPFAPGLKSIMKTSEKTKNSNSSVYIRPRLVESFRSVLSQDAIYYNILFSV